MEGNDQSQNNEAPKTDGQAPVSNVDGFITSPQPATTESSASVASPEQPTEAVAETPAPTVDTTSQAQPAHEVEVAKLKEQKKGMAVWLVVLLVILFAGAAAVAVYFYQSNQAKQDLDAQKAQTAQLQKQLTEQQQSSTQQQITDLNNQITTLKNQNAALQKTVDAQAAYIKTLTDTATKLKTTCGTACSSITIPTPPAGTTTSSSSSSSSSSTTPKTN
jgi:type II secretory pathway pseudopilin PulG